MQPNETYTVSRRALDVEDYIDILRRHKGWIFGPFLFTLVVSVVGGYLWPDTYISRGVIKVEPQQVPESLVQPTMTHDMIDAINSMTDSIESRGKLTEIITTYNLYLKERSREPTDDVIEEMKRQISIEPLGQSANRQVPAFAVSFAYSDKHQAQKVVEELMTRFMDESFHSQSNQTFQSTELMKDLADDAKKKLDEIEDRLAAYKMENNGRLPEQRSENYQKLTSLEANEASLESQINRVMAEKMNNEFNLRTYTHTAEEIAKIQPDPRAAAAAAALQQKSVKLQRAEAEVENLTTQLQGLQQHYTDSYPEVKTAKDFLTAAQAKRDQILKEEKEEAEVKEKERERDAKKEAVPSKPAQSQASAREEIERAANVTRFEQAIAADEVQIEDYKNQLKNVGAAIKTLNTRLDSVPQSEKEYQDLVHEKDIQNAHYEEMKKHLATAQITQEMENRKEGENLQILDPASLPETPSYPKHPQVIGIGAGIGLILGIVIAGAREMKDTSLKNLKDVRAYTQMAILGSIPLLENDFVVRRRRRLAWLGWTTACLTAVVLMAGSVVYYISTKSQ
jgi:polysaccharide biosynthesis transport protein